MLITLISHEDQIVKERAADTACTAKPFTRPETSANSVRRLLAWTTKSGGGERDRTDDPLLAKQVLSQLSYTPVRQNRCDGGGSGCIRTNDPRLIKTVL